MQPAAVHDSPHSALAYPIWVLAIGCLLMVQGAHSLAQETGTLRGTVVDEQGRSVDGARIVISRLVGGSRGFEIETGANGAYVQRDITAGLYTVTAGKAELSGEMFRVRVRPGRTVEINFLLSPGQRVATWLSELGENEAVARAFAAGLAASRAADFQTAIEQYTRAIERRPSCAECSFNLAVVYSQIEQFADAEKAFKRVLELRPDYAAAYYGLSSVYTHQSRSDEASRAREEANRLALARLAKRRQEAEDALNRAVTILNAGHVAEARRHLEGMLEQDSSFAAAHYWLAVSLLQSDTPDRAASEFRRYLQLDGDGVHTEQAREQLSQLGR